MYISSRYFKHTHNPSPLDQYVDKCQEAINRACGELKRPFRKLLSEILLLMMLVSNRVNFIQLAKYGKRSEQCYHQNFERMVDWVALNRELANTRYHGSAGKRAIGIDPSYIDKSGKHTPGLGRFWSGCAGEPKHGLNLIILINLKSFFLLATGWKYKASVLFTPVGNLTVPN